MRSLPTPRSVLVRRLPVIAGAILLTVAASHLAIAPAAAAHTALISSSPANGSRLAAPPTTVSVTFAQPVDARFSRIALDPGGSGDTELTARTEGNTVGGTTPTNTPKTSDRPWTVSYKVLADDGHPITGQVEFWVGAPPTPTAIAPNPDTSAEPAKPVKPKSLLPLALGISTTLLILLPGTALLVITNRRHQRSETKEPSSEDDDRVN